MDCSTRGLHSFNLVRGESHLSIITYSSTTLPRLCGSRTVLHESSKNVNFCNFLLKSHYDNPNGVRGFPLGASACSRNVFKCPASRYTGSQRVSGVHTACLRLPAACFREVATVCRGIPQIIWGLPATFSVKRAARVPSTYAHW